MKDNDTKRAFIVARAEGKSFSAITKELGISKSTCSSWEHSLQDQIEDLRRAQLEELYTSYSMTKEARIKSLGGIIQRIDEAIEHTIKPLEELPEDKLLELRLKYSRELQSEYTEPTDSASDNTLDGLLEEYDRLYIDSRSGKLSPTDVRAQLSILDAKRDTLYRVASEKSKEVEEDFSITLGYESPLLRHEEETA